MVGFEYDFPSTTSSGPLNLSNYPIDAIPGEPDGDSPLPGDNFGAVLRYLNQMLMDEDLEQRPCMYQDLSALQAAEKSFHDALTGVELAKVADEKEKEEDKFTNGSAKKEKSLWTR